EEPVRLLLKTVGVDPHGKKNRIASEVVKERIDAHVPRFSRYLGRGTGLLLLEHHDPCARPGPAAAQAKVLHGKGPELFALVGLPAREIKWRYGRYLIEVERSTGANEHVHHFIASLAKDGTPVGTGHHGRLRAISSVVGVRLGAKSPKGYIN